MEDQCLEGPVALCGSVAGEGSAGDAGGVFMESLGSIAVPLIVVGIWWSRAWRVGCGMCGGMSDAGMFVDHLACLLARRRRPYVAEQKVGRVLVNE